MKPVRLIDLVPKDGLGEVWVKVAVREEGISREGELTAKLTEGAMKKINEQASTEYGLQFLGGFCLLKVTQSDLPEHPFHVLATLEEKDDNPPKIFREPYRIRGKTLDFRLSRGKRG